MEYRFILQNLPNSQVTQRPNKIAGEEYYLKTEKSGLWGPMQREEQMQRWLQNLAKDTNVDFEVHFSSFLSHALLRLTSGCEMDNSFFLPTLRTNTDGHMQREKVGSQGLGHCCEETVPFEGWESQTKGLVFSVRA